MQDITIRGTLGREGGERMRIIEQDYNWKGTMTPRTKTNFIVVHHAAAKTCTPADIHLWHLGNGWAGIGYHYIVRKNGEVYRGRPEAVVGAQVQGYNDQSIGICFEGDFEKEEVPDSQQKAGIELLQFLIGKYPKAKIVRHKDLMSTSCPGKNFPDRIILEGMKPVAENPSPEDEGLRKAVLVVSNALSLASPSYWEKHPDKYVHVLLKKMAEYISTRG